MGIKTYSPKSESITFRLESASLEKLKAKAKEERISLNSLVNQVVANYSEWDIFATAAGWMVLSKLEVKKIFDKLTDDDIDMIAKEMSEYTKDIRLLMTEGDDFDGFLKMVRLVAKKSGFVYKESNNNDDIKLTVQHDLGNKWSLRTKRTYENILYEMGKRSKITTTPNTIMVNIENH